MTIWILALILWLFCALLGHKQGAIRAAISFIGILFSGVLAWPLSGLVGRVLGLVIHHPLTVWFISPLVAFVVVLAVFKWIGFMVHRKVWISYQYARDEIRLLWWQRMNRRVGMAIGFLNAFLYIALISVPIYNLSYWTKQIAPSDQEDSKIKLVNRMGQDLDATGMSKIACALDPFPDKYFKSADLAGLLIQNPSLGSRLAAYPPFLALAESPEFQPLAQDSAFLNTWQTHGTFTQLWSDSQIQTIWQNQQTVNNVWGLVEANLDDLTSYLHTGQSAKYGSEPILGRWDVNVVQSLHQMMRTHANVPSSQMAQLRSFWENAYSNTVFVAASDNEAFLKNYPLIEQSTNVPMTFNTAILQGTWQNSGNYDITLQGNEANMTGTGSIDNSELTLKVGNNRLILQRENE